jgi:hypothetical protein
MKPRSSHCVFLHTNLKDSYIARIRFGAGVEGRQNDSSQYFKVGIRGI